VSHHKVQNTQNHGRTKETWAFIRGQMKHQCIGLDCYPYTAGSTMIRSDGVPVGDQPHPRLWGTFPRVLGHYSRDLKLFPLETAIWKMTGLTARTFGLQQRGSLQPGHHADV